MADADRPHPGVLRPCGLDDDGPAALDADVARLHHRLRVELAARLLASVPQGWEVSAGCCWQPSLSEATLHPDVVDPRPARSYARLGVDHHWHIDSQHGTLQVSVRLDDVYRRCETFSAESLARTAASHEAAWVDFGVGIAHLDDLPLAPLTTPLSGWAS